MKVNCYKIKIDMKGIIKGIERFYFTNGKNPSYIIMNFHTQTKMKNEYLDEWLYSYIKIPSPKMIKFCDIPVAISESLEDGEVDIV